jgi:hypothetical protein
LGGVCGSVTEKAAITSDAPAATCIGSARASARSSRPISHPAAIHPTVPSTRMRGKSCAASFTWWKEMELVSDSVGMKHNAYRMSSG